MPGLILEAFRSLRDGCLVGKLAGWTCTVRVRMGIFNIYAIILALSTFPLLIFMIVLQPGGSIYLCFHEYSPMAYCSLVDAYFVEFWFDQVEACGVSPES